MHVTGRIRLGPTHLAKHRFELRFGMPVRFLRPQGLDFVHRAVLNLRSELTFHEDDFRHYTESERPVGVTTRVETERTHIIRVLGLAGRVTRGPR
jgi:hypothetical protein